MQHGYANGFSQQTISLYQLLQRHRILTAREIGESLHISPTAIYRIALHLQQYGLLEILDGFPKRFVANDIERGREKFLLHQRNWFDSIFQSNHTFQSHDLLDVSFIQSREETLAQCAQDVRLAKKEVKFIILGLSVGVPAEFVYEWKNALRRGVVIRMLVQELHEENREMLYRWKALGLDIKYISSFGWHLFLIDNTISYIMMYERKEKSKRLAVRLVHREINKKLQLLFHKEWQNAVCL